LQYCFMGCHPIRFSPAQKRILSGWYWCVHAPVVYRFFLADVNTNQIWGTIQYFCGMFYQILSNKEKGLNSKVVNYSYNKNVRATVKLLQYIMYCIIFVVSGPQVCVRLGTSWICCHVFGNLP
jgi:hypothetical protein